MQPQVIIIHDIKKAIEDVGIKPYANTLVQEMGGDYYFVEGESKPKEFWPMDYQLWKIPNKLAWFIIDCLRLKADAIRLGSNEYQEGSQAVYLTPGKEIFGHKIEQLTEIPAELMPVVVERL